METSSQASRRLELLARHIQPIGGGEPHLQQQQQSWLGASLSRMACSSVGGSRESFQRRDNRTLFARQSSDNQGQFTRPAVAKEVGYREDSRGPAPAAGSACGAAGETNKLGIPTITKSTRVASEDGPGPSFAAVEPLFARPLLETDAAGDRVTDIPDRTRKPVMPVLNGGRGECNSRQGSGCDGAGSARAPPSCGEEKAKKGSQAATNEQPSGNSFGFEWFPRMDVLESRTAHVITVELPGVSADGIHVEVVGGSLIVTGSRATDWWKVNSNGSNGGGTVYHRRELAQGPYRAVWRLPKNGDINGITAEFIDGFLRVLIPKIKIMTYL